MREFFRGWRRKSGVVTLLLALVLTGGWIRSLSIADIVTFSIPAFGRTYSMRSVKGRAEWYIFSGEPHLHRLRWMSQLSSNFPLLVANEERHLRGNQRAFQIPFRVLSLVTPYVAFITPLTLISAFLLLSKPLPSNQKKIAEPVPVEGT